MWKLCELKLQRTDVDCGMSGINVADYRSGQNWMTDIRAPEQADATELVRVPKETGGTKCAQ